MQNILLSDRFFRYLEVASIGFLLGGFYTVFSNLAITLSYYSVAGLVFSFCILNILSYFTISDLFNSRSLSWLSMLLFVALIYVILYFIFLFCIGSVLLLPFLPYLESSFPESSVLFAYTSTWLLPSFSGAFVIIYGVSKQLEEKVKNSWWNPPIFSAITLFLFSVSIFVYLFIYGQSYLYPVLSVLISVFVLFVVKLPFDIYGRIQRSKTNQIDVDVLLNSSKDYDINIPLSKSFSYIHEPILSDVYSNKISPSFVGRKHELRELIQRLIFSDGGAFLITGYRGVGKTSFVNYAIHNMKTHLTSFTDKTSNFTVLDIHLNLARPLSPAELMHHIVRCFYSVIQEQGILNQLSSHIQEELLLSLRRTSVNMGRSLGRTSEKGVEVSNLTGVQNSLGFMPIFGLSSKRSTNENLEMTYLSYDDKASEYDLIHLFRKIVQGYYPKISVLRKIWNFFLRRPNVKTPLKVIFVFDELDKLDEFNVPGNKPVIDEILNALKNLFTTSGLHFIFVAGKDLQDRWSEDISRGDSVYESVFAFNKYIPAMWNDISTLCRRLLDENVSLIESKDHTTYTAIKTESAAYEVYEAFEKYLTYRGRGIPRRILRNFNHYVQWNTNGPILAFNRSDIRRITFYSRLQKSLEDNDLLFRSSLEEIKGEIQDKEWLSIYYLIDWIFLQGEQYFSIDDAVFALQHLNIKIAPRERVALPLAQSTINTLLDQKYLEIYKSGPDQLIFGGQQYNNKILYRVPRSHILELGLYNNDDASEMAEDINVKVENYIVIELIGQGGMSKVYKAWDINFGREVALKILMNEMNNSRILNFFKQEGEILCQFDHQNLVKGYDFGVDGQQHYIAMQLIKGLSLRDVLDYYRYIDLEIALTIIDPIFSVVQFLHNKGVVRCDLKPSNILIDSDGHVFLIDLGIAKRIEYNDSDGEIDYSMESIIGTLRYMAPEQLSGSTVLDERVDIYSLGVVLYEMLTGVTPFENRESILSMRQYINDTPKPISDYILNLPSNVENAIMKSLSVDKENRFPSVKYFQAELPTVNFVDIGIVIREIIQPKVNSEKDDKDATEPARKSSNDLKQIINRIIHKDDTIMSSIPINSDHSQKATMPALTLSSTSLPSNFPSSPILESKNVLNCVLVVTSPASTLMQYQVKPNMKVTIGRGSDNNIEIHDINASRYHAVVEHQGDKCLLYDVASVNGTYLNGKLISGKTILSTKDVINIGETIIEVDFLI